MLSKAYKTIMEHQMTREYNNKKNKTDNVIKDSKDVNASNDFALSIAEKITAPSQGRSVVEVLTAPDRDLEYKKTNF